MGILYHFLSTLDSVSGKPSPQIRWENSLPTTWLPQAERNLRQLQESSIVQRSFMVGAMKCAAQREVFIHFRRLFEEYKKEKDSGCGFSLFARWKLTLEWKESILPFMANHQATLWIMSFYKSLASTLFSEVEVLQLCQHPYYRAKSLALKDKSLLSVAADAFVMTAWSSLLFYLASLTVGQVSFSYAQWKEYKWASVRKDSTAKGKCLQSWFKSSWETAYQQSLRCWYASLGSALGSMVLPGWGTLIGTGLGEEWADHQDVPSPPPALLSRFPQVEKYFAKSSNSKTTDSGSLQANELLCGCCQVIYFSSNPYNRRSAPISSHACEHTICRSCVNMCHLAYLQSEGVAFTEERLGCPICNADNAFSPNDHMVNQSLCNAIALLEKSREAEKSWSDQDSSWIEIDIGAVKKFGRLSQLEVASPRDAHSTFSA